jgi:hypothetical protein
MRKREKTSVLEAELELNRVKMNEESAKQRIIDEKNKRRMGNGEFF